MDKKSFGSRVKETRKSLKLTQEDLAEKADIGVVYLSEIERGLKSPSIVVFTKIAKALDVSADYLLRDVLPTGKEYVFDDLTKKLENLTPRQRKTVSDIIDAYLSNLEQ